MTDEELELEQAIPITDDERAAYHAFWNTPLINEDKELLISKGWAFLNEKYIYIPDDYDGCMAYGIDSIRRVLISYQMPELYRECRANRRIIAKRLGYSDYFASCKRHTNIC